MATPPPENEASAKDAPEKEAREKDEGVRRPTFAADFPRDPALDALVRAFTEGDYRRVRVEAPKLAKTAEDEDVRRAARVLRSRIEADPASVWLLVLTGALLVFLSAWWIAHGHEPEPKAPAAPTATVERIP